MSVKHSLLALLYEKSRHGYELKTGFDELVQSMWPLNTGQVYTTLDRLERDGLVVTPGHDQKDRKLYMVTDLGKEDLWLWLKEPVERSLLKDEFYFKYLCASHVDYKDKKVMIQAQKQTLMKDVLHLTHLKKQMRQSENRTMNMLMEGALLHLEADIIWLDMIAKD